MSQVKLPYCRAVVNVHESPFGVPEVEYPNLYESPIPGKVIVRVDILDKLRDRLDESCFICRDLLYALFSGAKSYYDYADILMSYYKKFPAFRKLVNDVYFYGDDTIPLVDRVLMPLRKELNTYQQEISEYLHKKGGKYLTTSRDYLYYAFPSCWDVPKVERAVYIC